MLASISQAVVDANAIVAFLPQLPAMMICVKVNAKLIVKPDQTMRIKNTTSLRELDKKVAKKSSFFTGTSSLFAAELSQQNAEHSSYEQEIEELRKEIELSGDKLEKEPTLPNFGHFRDLLSKLAKRISTEAYQLDKIGGTPQNPRYFEIITIINAEADRLYNLIINENKNHLAIAAKVINIKGMVVDLIT